MVTRSQRMAVWACLALFVTLGAGCGGAGRGKEGTQAGRLTVSVRLLSPAGCPVVLPQATVEATGESLLVRLTVESNTRDVVDSLSVECAVVDAAAPVQLPLAAPTMHVLDGRLESGERAERCFSIPMPSPAETGGVTPDSLGVVIEPVNVFFPGDRGWERPVAVPQ